jgi:transcriptional regulator with XRE-family HTH domain
VVRLGSLLIASLDKESQLVLAIGSVLNPWEGLSKRTLQMVQGRLPNLARRQLARTLREQGLTLANIGERMGISHQAVRELIASSGPTPDLLCSKCQARIVKTWKFRNESFICLACLKAMENPSFAEKLRAYRINQGWPQTRLAKEVDCSRRLIASYEQGVREPTVAMMDRLALALGHGLAD